VPANPTSAIELKSLSIELRHQRQIAHDACQNFNRAPSKGHLKKLKLLFARCGESVHIESGFHCDYGSQISLGDRVYLNINCTLLDGAKISIGDDCLIGPNVQILTVNHAICPVQRLEKQSFVKDVNIANNVWIGAGVIILPGVTIGQGAVIGAGSLVNRSVPDNTLFAGNPARKIREI
jgi:maltose O-acetyltransferase